MSFSFFFSLWFWLGFYHMLFLHPLIGKYRFLLHTLNVICTISWIWECCWILRINVTWSRCGFGFDLLVLLSILARTFMKDRYVVSFLAWLWFLLSEWTWPHKEFGWIPFCSIFWNSWKSIGDTFSFVILWVSVVKSSGPRILLNGSLLITTTISLLVVGLFRFPYNRTVYVFCIYSQ